MTKQPNKGLTVGVIIFLLLVVIAIFYLDYSLTGNWKDVEKTILESLIDMVVIFIVNMIAVLVGFTVIMEEMGE